MRRRIMSAVKQQAGADNESLASNSSPYKKNKMNDKRNSVNATPGK